MKNIVLLIPADAWKTLRETLEKDTRSSAFDPTLRQEIKQALEQVQPITGQVGALVELLACELSATMPADCRATHPALVKARSVLAKVAPKRSRRLTVKR